MKVDKEVYKFIAPGTPKELRLSAALSPSGPEGLTPSEALSVICLLCYDKETEVKTAAENSLNNFDKTLLVAALTGSLDPFVLQKVASIHPDDNVTIEIMKNVATDEETLKTLARGASKAVITQIMEDKDLLVNHPTLFGALKENTHLPHSASEVEEAHKAAPMEEEPEELLTEIEEIAPEPVEEEPKEAPAKEEKKEEAKEAKEEAKEEEKDKKPKKDPSKFDPSRNIAKQILEMTVSQKVKVANMGNKEVRDILIKEKNKLITTAVLNNPRFSDDEVLKLTSTKGTPDDQLRLISRNRDWMKNYQIKLSLVTNAKTPAAITMRMVPQLMDKDIQKLSKSKNVPGVVAVTAKKTLELRQKK